MNWFASRRNVLEGLGSWGIATFAAGIAGWDRGAQPAAAAAPAPTTLPPVRYCLNTSTIQGQKLSLPEEVKLAAEAGYDAIEPWIREIQEYVASGKSLRDLHQQIVDAGLTVDSAIGFATWIVDDDARRAEGFETMKRDMDLLRQIGGTRIAAPPVGATDQSDLNLERAAQRYAELLALGRSMGVIPQLEVWGFSQSLGRLGEVVHVAVAAGDPDACLLPDVYHLFKGESDFRGLALLHGNAIRVMHLNDYPGDIPRDRIGDADRVYPGDGVAPLPHLIHQLRANGFAGTFSLELFNRQYWQQPAEVVARTGLEKMKASVARSEAVTGW
jgi:2-keto-myo-inositol isomerase